MKLITAIIKPFKLEAVRQKMIELHIDGMTVTEVKGFGRQQGHSEIYRGAEYAMNFLPKLRIEMGVSDALAEICVEGLRQSAHTGQIGDGKILVTPIEHVVRIRTGETNEEAL